jgi:outer membrane protein OmpA-like peptidoglycan-associated protein
MYAKTADFSIIIDEKFNNALVDVTEDYDRSISAVGFIKEYKQEPSQSSKTYTNAFDYLSSLSNAHGSQIHLVKVDKYADILLRKSMNLEKFNEPIGIVKTPQNGYLIGGYTLDGSLLLIKIDSSGNKIFTKQFGTLNQSRMNKIILLRDGGILAIGSAMATRANHNIFENGFALNDVYLARFSGNGTMLWSKKYGSYDDDAGVDAAEAADGSLIVLGKKNSNMQTGITLMRVTQNGDKIWLQEYINEKKATPYKIIKLRDNNFAVSLSQKDEVNKEQIRLLKIDLHKNILLDKTLNTTYPSVLKDIKESLDGKIIGVGFVQDNYDTDGLAMLLDSKFSMLSQEHYGSNENDSFSALSILHNSQIAVAGVYTQKESQETNMWLLKLNRDLTISQISNSVTTFYAQLLDLFKEEIQANKISIKEDLSIRFNDESLYFKIGEYILTNPQKKFLDLFGKKLLTFLYKNKENIKTVEINGHTSSEWGKNDFSSGYLNNEDLSMKRSFATLSHIFNNQDEKTKKWLAEVLKGSGLSFSKKIMLNEVEEKERSRRVSFKIILFEN